jgi:hypothetical protein
LTARVVAAGDIAAAVPDPHRPQRRDILYTGWGGPAELAVGESAGTVVEAGSVRICAPVGQLSYRDPHTGETGTYDYATWTSPAVPLHFAATEVIASWTASTPGRTWLQVELSGSTELGRSTGWFVLGRWAAGDGGIRRTSVPAQADADGDVRTDRFVAAEGRGLTHWTTRVILCRPAGAGDSPELRSIGAVASRVPTAGAPVASTPSAARGVVLDVPRYSQFRHAGRYRQWGGGGEAWCSAASTAMVVAFWGAGPSPADCAWVDPGCPHPGVVHAARGVYDHEYAGTGNWPFNTAYAGLFGLRGFVTRLRSLTDAEAFVAAGIPLVLSASFRKGQVPGLSYGTDGHLLVLVGFSASGQPVVNDPASPTDAEVRKTVGRAELEAAWLTGSQGVGYVIHPASVPLPDLPGLLGQLRPVRDRPGDGA